MSTDHKQLGIAKQTLSGWLAKAHSAKLADANQSNKPTQSSLEAENKGLKQALVCVEMERDILKKATAYFARESLRGMHL